MKRTLAIGAVVGSLAVPSPASAAVRTYKGTAVDDPATPVTVKTKKIDGKRYMTLFKVSNLAISCNEGMIDARLGGVRWRGEEKLSKKGRFQVHADNGAQAIRVAGKATRSSARGTVRYTGLTQIGDQMHGCDSGRREWTATR